MDDKGTCNDPSQYSDEWFSIADVPMGKEFDLPNISQSVLSPLGHISPNQPYPSLVENELIIPPPLPSPGPTTDSPVFDSDQISNSLIERYITAQKNMQKNMYSRSPDKIASRNQSHSHSIPTSLNAIRPDNNTPGMKFIPTPGLASDCNPNAPFPTGSTSNDIATASNRVVKPEPTQVLSPREIIRPLCAHCKYVLLTAEVGNGSIAALINSRKRHLPNPGNAPYILPSSAVNSVRETSYRSLHQAQNQFQIPFSAVNSLGETSYRPLHQAQNQFQIPSSTVNSLGETLYRPLHQIQNQFQIPSSTVNSLGETSYRPLHQAQNQFQKQPIWENGYVNRSPHNFLSINRTLGALGTPNGLSPSISSIAETSYYPSNQALSIGITTPYVSQSILPATGASCTGLQNYLWTKPEEHPQLVSTCQPRYLLPNVKQEPNKSALNDPYNLAFEAIGQNPTFYQGPAFQTSQPGGDWAGIINQESDAAAYKIHSCLVCGRIFTTGSALGGHVSSHSKKRKREVVEQNEGVVFKADETSINGLVVKKEFE